MSKLKLQKLKTPSIYYFTSIILRNAFVGAKLSDKIAYIAFLLLVLTVLLFKSIAIIEYITISIKPIWHGLSFGSFAFVVIAFIFWGVEFLIRKNKIFNYCIQSHGSKINFLLWQMLFQTLSCIAFLALIHFFKNFNFFSSALFYSTALVLFSNFLRVIFPIKRPKTNNHNFILSIFQTKRIFIHFPKISFLSSSFYFWRKNIINLTYILNVILLIIGAILTSIYVQNAFPIIGFFAIIILMLQISLYDFEPKKLTRDLSLNSAQVRIFFNDTRALIAPYLILFTLNSICFLYKIQHDFLYINYTIILFSVWLVWIWQNALNLRGKKKAWISVAQAIIFCVILLFAFLPAGIISMTFWAWHIFNQQSKIYLKGNY